MSFPVLLEDPELTGGLPGGDEVNPVPSSRIPGHVARGVLSGTSALGLGTVLERGLGFLANILAARWGGAATFGAYSLAISTANNISTYAAGGIGSTAAKPSKAQASCSPRATSWCWCASGIASSTRWRAT